VLVDSGFTETFSHPFLTRHTQSSVDPNNHFWEVSLESQLLRLLEDHRIEDTVVLPASFYIEMVLAGAREVLGANAVTLEEVAFKRVMVVDPRQPAKLQLVISIGEGGEASFSFASLPLKHVGKQKARWILHVEGKIKGAAEVKLSSPEGFALAATRGRCGEVVSGEQHYDNLRARGLHYGPAFRCVDQVLRNCQESIGRLRLPQDVSTTASYIVHPGLLDSAFQVLATTPKAANAAVPEDIYVPVGVRSLRINAPLSPDDTYWGYGIFHASAEDATDEVESDLYVLREDGSPALVACGIRAQRFTSGSYARGSEAISDWLHRIEWVKTTSPQSRTTVMDSGNWLIFMDQTGFGDKLSLLLRDRGENVVQVLRATSYRKLDGQRYELDSAQPEHFRRLFQEAFADSSGHIRGILHLWSLDVAPPDELTIDTLNDARSQTCASALHLIQAVAAGESTAARVYG
jgi:myxalamid-type polyketide synthase MxaE and MxaD